MKTFILTAITFAAVPLASFAATYHYVDMEGQVADVEADSAAEALVVAGDKAPASGVALDTGVLEEGDSVAGATDTDVFQYVDVNGEVQFMQAASASVALQASVDKAPHSGVLDIDETVAIPASAEVEL